MSSVLNFHINCFPQYCTLVWKLKRFSRYQILKFYRSYNKIYFEIQTNITYIAFSRTCNGICVDIEIKQSLYYGRQKMNGLVMHPKSSCEPWNILYFRSIFVQNRQKQVSILKRIFVPRQYSHNIHHISFEPSELKLYKCMHPNHFPFQFSHRWPFYYSRA